MPDDLSGLYSRVLAAISSEPTQKIDFYAGFWPINAVAFARVYAEIMKHLMSKRMGIEVRVGEVTEGAGAEYKYLEDTYIFPNNTFGTTVIQQAAIVHESVHAWIDIQGYIGSASDADNEAAAYITESLFFFYATGRGCLDRPHTDRLPRDAIIILGVADRIALSIKDTAKAKVSDKDFQNMVDAILPSQLYQRIHTTRHTSLRANGIMDSRFLTEDALMVDPGGWM
jgi:hypothetical protein